MASRSTQGGSLGSLRSRELRLSLQVPLGRRWSIDAGIALARAQGVPSPTWYLALNHASEQMGPRESLSLGGGAERLPTWTADAQGHGAASMLGAEMPWDGSVTGSRNADFEQLEFTSRLQAPRFSLSQRSQLLREAHGISARADLGMQTALVAFPGGVAWTDTVADSFAVLRPMPKLQGVRLLVDPSGQTAAAASDYAGAPVLNNLVSYSAREIQVDAMDLPAGQRLGDDRQVLQPAYRSGLVVVVGSPAQVQVRGSVVDGQRQPLSFVALQLQRDGSDAVIDLFSNRKGRFVSEPLAPGTYRLRLPGAASELTRITIRDDMDGALDLPPIQLTSP
jgi:outer membrane usher protein FimD/PapC